MRILDQLGKQYGVFNDYTDGIERFASYDIAIKQDPSFAFAEADLLTPAGKFWNGMINLWEPRFYLSDGSWVFNRNFGWIFDTFPDGIHPITFVFESDRFWREYPMTWDILPDGMMETHYTTRFQSERQRFWIPLAEEPITEDPVTGDPIVPAIRRFYVLEYENQAPDARIQPRINIEQEVDIPVFDFLQNCTPDWMCTTTP